MELSFPELLLILAIALVVLGPKDMVKTAQQLGRWMGKMRTQFNNMKVMLDEEVLEDERKKLDELINKDIIDKKHLPQDPPNG
jgi:sec-independent protein translocase protein TatB